MYLGSAYEAAKGSALAAAGGAIGAVAQLAPHPSAGSHRHSGRGANIAGAVRGNLSIALELLDAAVASLVQLDVPSIGDAITTYMGNGINEQQLRSWIALVGGRPVEYDPLIRATRRKPETVESGILRNRQYITDDEYDVALRQLGFTDPGERTLVGALRNEVVGPSDLVRFALRHVFEPDLTARFGHNAEYRPVLDFYHQTAGLNYQIFTGPLRPTIVGTLREQPELYTELQQWAQSEGLPAPPEPDSVPEWLTGLYQAQGLPQPTWAKAFWWSHWVWPSPGQAYEMLFRLRPDRIKDGEPDWMKPLTFTIEDVRALLRGNDYAPYWRDRLASLAYRIPGIRQLRLYAREGRLMRPRIVDILRRTGYTDADADFMADAYIRDETEKEREKLWGKVAKELERAWELGLISDDEVRQEYANAGIDQQLAEAEVQSWIAKRNSDIAKSLLADIRKRYLAGRINDDEAISQMSDVGIVDRRRREYIRVWRSEVQTKHRELQAGQLVKFAGESTISMAELALRLRNLHYSDRDVEILLAQAQIARAAAQAKAAKELYAAEQRSLRALRQQQRDLAAAKRATERALAKRGTVAQLKTWYCDGEILAADVTDRMRALGHDDLFIQRILGECDAKRQKAGLPTYSEETGTQAFPLE